MIKRSIIIFLLAGSPFFLKAQTSGRDNAGLQGNAGAVSGFFETTNPINYPAGATSWWHLLDIRHNNTENNYAMQFAGSFFDQNLWFRKTNDNPAQPWVKVVLEKEGKVGIGTNNPLTKLDVNGIIQTYNKDTDIATWDNLRLWSDGVNGFIEANGDENGLIIRSNQGNKILLMSNVGIGTTTPQEKLSVNGKIRAQEVKVETSNWPDYVFAEDYKPTSLEELEKFVKTNKHLPEMPTAKEAETDGINLGEMNKLLLKKVEELTLLLIEQNQKNTKQSQEISQLQLELKDLKKAILKP